MPYRTAVWGLIVSLLLAIGWCYAAGLNLGFAAFEILVYICIIAVVMARSTAEGGLLMTETSFRPIDLYQLVASKATLGAQSLTILSFLDAIFTRDQRGLILTGFLDGLKIRDRVGMSYRSLLGVFVLGSMLAFLCAAAIHLWLPYTHGANYMYSYTYRGNPLWAFRDNVAAMEGLGADLRTTGGFLFRYRCACDNRIGHFADVILVVAPASTWICTICFLDAYRVLVSGPHRVEYQDADPALQRYPSIPTTSPFFLRYGIWRVYHGGCVDAHQLGRECPCPLLSVAVSVPLHRFTRQFDCVL